ncbi:16S rRNA (uracil(1498)-N(3))-methyltransferase [Robertmurraya kyonggiensis]|uniref:Ribosomal RNA small subunit methyltransferase E n=1 Tax=Robertmurraya kyonggiensis TaxID=1037680 RepID=A0A4U1DBS1_9BACI|nr:16S rRNA (uracil(1498)-N(3))-methyltransferase [Robertmurraya kyonggiensis]TKC19964.1 16S rRNA (uracil(1498)-N(3))-methyltransferase [Robertmurraya kyonggiensis]
MQRYFVNDLNDDTFYISQEDRHHIVTVMRLKIGDQIICVNNGRSAICAIEEITDDQVVAEVVKWEEESVELPVHVAIASGLPKGDKLEWIIQKGTELGASTFIPFTASRSVVKWDDKKAAKKVERWNKIAKEAAEQSHRQISPEVQSPISLKQLIAHAMDYDYKLIAFEEDAKQGEIAVLHSVLKDIEKGQSLLFVFGPEGGLTNEEVSILKENGFQSCGLGPRILRTETAPLYALSAVSYQTELMR